jgi:hypothetical protein
MFTAGVAQVRFWASLAAIHPTTSKSLLVAVVLVTAAVASGCGGGGGQSRAHTGTAPRAANAHHHAGPPHKRTPTATALPATSVRLRYRPLYRLAAPLRDPAYAALGGGRFVMLGGLDGADASVADIEIGDLHRVLHTGALPGPQHDAQAALLDGRVYVFGGGFTTELDHILMYEPNGGRTSPVGTLSVPQSDAAVAQAGGTAYVVGGFDGVNYLPTIVAWRPGHKPAVVAQLPQGLRYAGVAITGGGLFVLGGVSPAGTSDAIYRFDLATHRVRRIGTLPHPTEHTNAVTLGSTIYLVGGRGAGDTEQTSAIYALDPATGHLRPAGRLPMPTSDAAVMTIGKAIVVVGGQSPTGTLAGVGELTPPAA